MSIPATSISSTRNDVYQPGKPQGPLLSLAGNKDEWSAQYRARVGHVKDPKLTVEDFVLNLLKDAVTLGKKEGKVSTKKVLGLTGRQLKPLIRLWWEFKRSDKYLPQVIQNRVRKYKWTTYWWDKLVTNRFDPGYAQRKLLNLKGPLAIKQKQATVNKLEAFLDNALLDDMLPKHKIVSFALKIFRSRAKRQAKIYGPLVDSTPQLPQAYFEKELKAIAEAYRAQHGEGFKISKCLGSGSMGQVFLAESDSGKKLAVKVLRPDADTEFLKAYDAYLYRQALIMHGVKDKPAAYREALGSIAILRQEADLMHEKAMGEEFAAWLQSRGITSFEVPRFLTGIPQGFVQEYAGDYSLGQLKRQGMRALSNKTFVGIAPDLADAYAASPKKYLDWHLGNILTMVENQALVGKPRLIDFGRAVHLQEDVHRDLMRAIIDVMKQSHVKNAIRNPQKAHSFSHSASHSSSPAASRSDALLSDPGILEQILHEKPSDALLSITDESKPTGINFWLNYAKLQSRHPELHPLTPMPITNDDRKNVVKKFKTMLSTYFSAEVPEEVPRELEFIRNMSLADFEKLISCQDWEGRTCFYSADSRQAQQAREDLMNALLKKDENAFNSTKEALLKDEASRAWLQLTYRQNTRWRSIAEKLADGMAAVSGHSLSQQELKNVVDHIAHGLRHDFKL